MTLLKEKTALDCERTTLICTYPTVVPNPLKFPTGNKIIASIASLLTSQGSEFSNEEGNLVLHVVFNTDFMSMTLVFAVGRKDTHKIMKHITKLYPNQFRCQTDGSKNYIVPR